MSNAPNTPRYPAYKPTNIPWCPEIPEGWEVRRLKGLFSLRHESYSPNEQLRVLSLIKDVGVIPYEEKGTLGNKSKEDISGYNVARKGDIVMNSMNVIIGSVDITPFDGYISPAYYALTAREGVETQYFNHLFHLQAVQKTMRSLAKGILEIRLRISITNLLGMTFPFPPLPTQRAIVAYLDEKCGKIDRLVAAKERKGALLRELKQAVIAEAVTRGIRPHRLRPANIPWLPQIPEGWEVKKVRQHFRLRSEKVSEQDYPPLSVAKMGVVPQLADVAISMAQGETRKLVRKGDYVVNSRSDRKGSCGIAPQDGSVTTISIVLEPRQIDRQFIHYLFRSTPWVEEFYRNGRGIVADLWTTRYQEMRNMAFPVPPPAEQAEIVAYLEARCGKIDAAVAGLEASVAALKAYKQRLIADVVTGQRRVP